MNVWRLWILLKVRYENINWKLEMKKIKVYLLWNETPSNNKSGFHTLTCCSFLEVRWFHLDFNLAIFFLRIQPPVTSKHVVFSFWWNIYSDLIKKPARSGICAVMTNSNFFDLWNRPIEVTIDKPKYRSSELRAGRIYAVYMLQCKCSTFEVVLWVHCYLANIRSLQFK